MKYTKTIRASKAVRPARRISASRAALQRKSIKADDEIDDLPPVEDVEVDAVAGDGDAEVTVEPEASELLFEAEDVAELIAEVTGDAVDVTVDEDQVVFAIGEDEYTVTPEGDEVIVEDSKRVRGHAIKAGRAMRRPMARRVAASRRASAARRVAASRKPSAARKVSASRRIAARRPQK